MRHGRANVRLKQKPGHARMLKRNLVTSLLLYENVRTTKRRAQAIQPLVENLIHYAKKRPAHVAIRYINAQVTDKNASRKVMEVFIKRYAQKNSGITRIVPAGARKGDGAELVDLMLIDSGVEVSAPQAEEKKAAPKKKTTTKKASSSKK